MSLADIPIPQYNTYFTGPAAPYVYAPDRLHLAEVGPYRYARKYYLDAIAGLKESYPLIWMRMRNGYVCVDNPYYANGRPLVNETRYYFPDRVNGKFVVEAPGAYLRVYKTIWTLGDNYSVYPNRRRAVVRDKRPYDLFS